VLIAGEASLDLEMRRPSLLPCDRPCGSPVGEARRARQGRGELGAVDRAVVVCVECVERAVDDQPRGHLLLRLARVRRFLRRLLRLRRQVGLEYAPQRGHLGLQRGEHVADVGGGAHGCGCLRASQR
jgi:hypothetical protein